MKDEARFGRGAPSPSHSSRWPARARAGMMAVLLIAGCSADGSGGSPCTSQSDCRADQMCIDGRCQGLDAGTDGQARVDGAIDAPACTEDCGDGTCINGTCCPAAQTCGGACCAEMDLCSFNRCVPIGSECQSEDDCAAGEYCESLLGDTMRMCDGAPVINGRCLPRPPSCMDGVTPDPANPDCIAECSFVPPAANFEVTELYSWGMFDGDGAPPNATDIRNSPIVIQLDDDDCDGRVTGRDIPEIVFTTSETDGTDRAGDLVVLSVDNGTLVEKWRIRDVTDTWTYLAAGNIDGQPGNEIVACGNERQEVVAFHVNAMGQLEELWRGTGTESCLMPVIADLDQNGQPEVLAAGVALSGVDGTTRFTFPESIGRPIAMNVDGDANGQLEVIGNGRIFRLTGGSFTTIANAGTQTSAAWYPLAADLEPGGLPEIVAVDWSSHTLSVFRYDGAAGVTMIRGPVDINGPLDPTMCPLRGDGTPTNGRIHGGGPPTAADVNGDGIPDIATAGGVGYSVFDGAKLVDLAASDAETFLWTERTDDCTSAQTGSSVFDFNGDGRSEVLYADQRFFRIYEGQGDGAGGARVLFETCNTNGTILEMPIVADVDSDGQADIVVVSNARYFSCLADPTTRRSGLRVFGNDAGTWVRTRSVWNQHDYHITNIEDDGTVPAREPDNYSTPGLNNFRTNRQPGNQFAATDATLTLSPSCENDPAVLATVRNLGESVLPRGATVSLFEGTPAAPGASLGTQTTTVPLYPAQAEALRFPVPNRDLVNGQSPLFGEVQVPASIPECRSDNNTANALTGSCLR
ncbi:MAG: FG-GAP-like repeat-containing protein [Myxococcota bacterium]